jgi:membrane protein involved in colicin uptake
VAHRLLVTVIVLLILALSFSSIQAQNPGLPSSPQLPAPSDPTTPAEDAARSKLERDMAKKANQERQIALKRDTEKLLKLSTELKEYVDKTNENMLSLDVVKKAEEIEKLAHSVKTKMKGN